MTTKRDDVRILVAEDIAAVAEPLCRDLSAKGAKVVGPVYDLAKARRLASRGSFDVVVLDVKLNGESVYDFVREVRRRKRQAVFLTSFVHDANGRGAASALPTDLKDVPLLAKPVPISVLWETIRLQLDEAGRVTG